MESPALQTFRQHFYNCLTRRADALFELADALLTSAPVSAPVHLSLHPLHRRGWGSLYATLHHGVIDVPALRALLARHPLAGGFPFTPWMSVPGRAVMPKLGRVCKLV